MASPPPYPDQAPVLADDPVAGNQDGQMVGGDQPPDLPGVETGGAGHIFVGPGLSEWDLPKCFEDRNLGWGEIEPALQVLGVGKGPRGAAEIVIEPLSSSRHGPWPI